MFSTIGTTPEIIHICINQSTNTNTDSDTGRSRNENGETWTALQTQINETANRTQPMCSFQADWLIKQC